MLPNEIITLHRKLSENSLWRSEVFTKGQAWVDLIILAEPKKCLLDVRGIMVSIKRGQVGRSELELATRWRWSRGKVRRFLKWLETEQQIVQQKTNVTSLITLTNYERYQKGGTMNSTPDGHQTDTRLYPEKEEKYTPAFNAFWQAYPKKVGKMDAYKAWLAHRCHSIGSKIRESIKKHVETEQWKKEGGQFIPNPGTYLRQHRWEDEIVAGHATGSKLADANIRAGIEFLEEERYENSR